VATLHALLQLAVTTGALLPLVLAANGLYHLPRPLLAAPSCRDIVYAVRHTLQEMRHWAQVLADVEVAEISGQPIAAASPEAILARCRFANDKSLSVAISPDGKTAKSSSAGNSYAVLGTPCGQVRVG
jgi:hypothetical protein